MSKELEKKCEELQSTIEVLQNENSLLAEKSEETLLISKVSQSINSIDNRQVLLETVLEEISILTNISYCTCCELNASTAYQTYTYSSFSEDDYLDSEIQVSSSILRELVKNGFSLLTGGSVHRKGLQINFKGNDFTPYTALFYSFTTSSIPKGVFIFIDDEADKYKLPAHSLLLQNIVNMVVEKLDKISLIEELKQMNTKLEEMVKTRTLSLAESNEKLKNEIREHKQSEINLRRLRNYLSNIIDSMPSILIGVDIDGMVTQWNKKVEQSTGITAETAQGKYIGDLVPRMVADIDNVLKSIQTKQIIYERKKSYLTVKGTRYEDITIYPLVTDEFKGAVIRVDDVTEQVQLEEAMIQSEKMISIGALAAGMAHEINNPLGAIMSAAQITARRLSPGIKKNKLIADQVGIDLNKIDEYLTETSIHKYLTGIRESGERAAKIVRNMLDFSRKAESVKTECDLHDILDKALELASNDYDLKKNYDFRSIQLIRDYDENLPKINAIETEIGQVFLNLYKNAAQAILEKKYYVDVPTIILRTRLETDWIRIEVEDNGSGMDEETRKRVFEPFFTTKSVGSGTGLGLSVSYFIITNNHKGKLVVDSSQEKGTKFTIRIPCEAFND